MNKGNPDILHYELYKRLVANTVSYGGWDSPISLLYKDSNKKYMFYWYILDIDIGGKVKIATGVTLKEASECQLYEAIKWDIS